MDNQANFETLWDNLLSRQPERVKAAFSSLDPPSQEYVETDLQSMATEEGWHPEQRKSARAALKYLKNIA